MPEREFGNQPLVDPSWCSIRQKASQLVITQNGRNTTRNFPRASTFDENSLQVVRDLNKWRHQLIRWVLQSFVFILWLINLNRSKVGRTVRNESGERYHPHEIAFFEEIFMNSALIVCQTSAVVYKKRINYKVITQQHTDSV
jgi:hypothetical protein